MDLMGNRLDDALEEQKPIDGSVFDDTAKELTVNDVRMLLNKCMPQLIDACKKGSLIDINSIIREYWEIQFARLTSDELLSHLNQYGEDDENCRFTKVQMETALKKHIGTHTLPEDPDDNNKQDIK